MKRKRFGPAHLWRALSLSALLVATGLIVHAAPASATTLNMPPTALLQALDTANWNAVPWEVTHAAAGKVVSATVTKFDGEAMKFETTAAIEVKRDKDPTATQSWTKTKADPTAVKAKNWTGEYGENMTHAGFLAINLTSGRPPDAVPLVLTRTTAKKIGDMTIPRQFGRTTHSTLTALAST